MARGLSLSPLLSTNLSRLLSFFSPRPVREPHPNVTLAPTVLDTKYFQELEVGNFITRPSSENLLRAESQWTFVVVAPMPQPSESFRSGWTLFTRPKHSYRWIGWAASSPDPRPAPPAKSHDLHLRLASDGGTPLTCRLLRTHNMDREGGTAQYFVHSPPAYTCILLSSFLLNLLTSSPISIQSDGKLDHLLDYLRQAGLFANRQMKNLIGSCPCPTWRHIFFTYVL